MINSYRYKDETWLDIDHGTPDEIHSLMDTYGIHPFVAKELTSTTPKPRIEIHKNYVYLILHFPAWKHTHSENKNQEVDFIILKNTLITARYDTIDALHQFAKDIEVEEILEKDFSGEGTSYRIFIAMLRRLYGALFQELEAVEDTVEEITGKIFRGHEKEMVVSISEVSRTLLDFRRTIDLHHEILETLHRHGKEIFGEEFARELEIIVSDYLKINMTLKSQLDVLKELRETNNSLLTSKQNETVKHFTVIGTILLVIDIIITILLL